MKITKVKYSILCLCLLIAYFPRTVIASSDIKTADETGDSTIITAMKSIVQKIQNIQEPLTMSENKDTTTDTVDTKKVETHQNLKLLKDTEKVTDTVATKKIETNQNLKLSKNTDTITDTVATKNVETNQNLILESEKFSDGENTPKITIPTRKSQNKTEKDIPHILPIVNRTKEKHFYAKEQKLLKQHKEIENTRQPANILKTIPVSKYAKAYLKNDVVLPKFHTSTKLFHNAKESHVIPQKLSTRKITTPVKFPNVT